MTPLTSASLFRHIQNDQLRKFRNQASESLPSDTQPFSSVPHQTQLFLNLDQSRGDLSSSVSTPLTKQESSVEVNQECEECFESSVDDREDLRT